MKNFVPVEVFQSLYLVCTEFHNRVFQIMLFAQDSGRDISANLLHTANSQFHLNPSSSCDFSEKSLGGTGVFYQ